MPIIGEPNHPDEREARVMTPHPRRAEYFATVSERDAPTEASAAETAADALRACDRVAPSRLRAIVAPVGLAGVRGTTRLRSVTPAEAPADR
jgi:hypothetical protein